MGHSNKNRGIIILSSILFVMAFFSCTKEIVIKELFDSQFEHFTDSRDGHVYNQITLGKQTWMAENLAYLPQVNKPTELSSNSKRYYVYDYNGNNVDEAIATRYYKSYGVLYNWAAADSSCPSGWHLPTEKEWSDLQSFLVGSVGTEKTDSIPFYMMTPFSWSNYLAHDSIDVNKTGRNKTLFSAVPGGYLYDDGAFYSEKSSAFWWSADSTSENNAGAYILTYNSKNLYLYEFNKEAGFSVRCVKD